MFCTNCGQQFPDEAKFCPNCGMEAGQSAGESQGERKVTYVGEVRKCPSCGMELPGFAAICPSCGYEIYSQQVHPVMVKFANELDACDKKIALEEKRILRDGRQVDSGWSSWGTGLKVGWVILNICTYCIPLILYLLKRTQIKTPGTKRKASLIENFQIPNDRGAMLEALYFIQGKVQLLSYEKMTASNVYWINLWGSKAVQLCEKAQVLLPEDKNIISGIYEDITSKVEYAQKASRTRIAVIIGLIAIFIVFSIIRSNI